MLLGRIDNFAIRAGTILIFSGSHINFVTGELLRANMLLRVILVLRIEFSDVVQTHHGLVLRVILRIIFGILLKLILVLVRRLAIRLVVIKRCGLRVIELVLLDTLITLLLWHK